MAENETDAAVEENEEPQDTNKFDNILSLAEIRAAEDITDETVPVEEWGGSVVIRSISHRKMMDLKKNAYDDDAGKMDEDEMHAQLLIQAMIKPTITREDYEWMKDKSTAAIMKILNAVTKNSGMNTKAALKEAEKQFRTGPK